MKIVMELESETFESQKLQVEAQKDEQEEQDFHVLVIDDSLVARKHLKRLFHDFSYNGIKHAL